MSTSSTSALIARNQPQLAISTNVRTVMKMNLGISEIRRSKGKGKLRLQRVEALFPALREMVVLKFPSRMIV